MKINLRAMMLASGLMISMIPFMPGEANAIDPENTATGQEKRGLMDITYMQEMAPNICTNSSENATKQLIDSRDGKSYWVTKLKDGNCWMTQNLDLDLYANGANRKLTSADSDVTSNWTSTAGASGLWTGSSSNYNVVKYYDPGEYAYTKPTNHLNNGCGALDSTACADAGWKLMSGSSTDSSGSETTHYLAGNYYSWGAATAGGQSVSTGAAGESIKSICPKGWRLPINSGDKSYTDLFAAYGTLSGLNAGTQDIRLAPLYFVYGSGVVNGYLGSAGSSGYYWSSTSDLKTSAYYLAFGTSVYPSGLSTRSLGYSVRCVSRADVPDNNDNVTITITPTLSLDVAATTEIPYTAGGISTGNLSAIVKSNQQHAIQLSAAEPNLVNEADSNKTIPADAGVSAGTSAWGIKKKKSATGTPLGSTTDVSDYTALTSTPDIFYRSAAGSEGTASIDFTVGISTDSSVASGTYSTNVTVTATTI